MFKTAPRYLSGVSVFLGDDITRRNTEGELVMFIGQAEKGPRTPITINGIDNAVSIFGTNNPIVKAMHQFWDGYLDSEQVSPLKLVALRIGGVPAKVTTSFGVTFETSDAYTGIEDDFFVYINNSATAANRVIKVWNKLKIPVYNSATSLNGGYVSVTGDLDGSGGLYGVDIDNDPTEIPVSLKQLADLNVVNPSGVAIKASADIAALATTLIGVLDNGDPLTSDVKAVLGTSGKVLLQASVGAVTYKKIVSYAFNSATDTFTVPEGTFSASDPFVLVPNGTKVSIKLVASTIQLGDSELDLTKQEKYEYFRRSLPDIEQFTPDYVVPGGVAVDEVEIIAQDFTSSTALKQDVAIGNNTITVDGASTWPATGTVTIDMGKLDANAVAVVDQVKYSAITVSGTDYVLTVKETSLKANAVALINADVIEVKDGVDPISDLTDVGFIMIGAQAYYYEVDANASDDTQKTLNIQPYTAGVFANTGLVAQLNVDAVVLKVAGDATTIGAVVTNSWTEDVELPLGIGYVKETEAGGTITFEWSPTGQKENGYNLAHFGYLFAKFCNDAAVGFNVPLCAMNTTIPADTTRAGIVEWIGTFPTFIEAAGGIENVALDGTGLLGDPAIVGSTKYNRCYMTDASAGVYADPALGFLLTDTGFIDGHEEKDGYGNVVDLGKYMCAGAGILTFRHRAAAAAYNDACGIYALGMLAGMNKNEGISFGRIGTRSNVTVNVVVNRKYYNDLAKAGYIVVTREKGLGWVINNDHTCSREDSGYYLISTTRTIKTVVEAKREILVGFIGKPVNRYYFEAARTKIADSFKKDVATGYLKGFSFDLQVAEAARAIGKLYLKCSLNPPLELTQVDVDTVIDRNNNNIQ